MPISPSTPIVTDGTRDKVPSAPRVALPGGAVEFAERAARFARLAEGHGASAYLRLLAAIARAQSRAIGRRVAPPLPAEAIEASREGVAPLGPLAFVRAPAWRDDLADLLAEVAASGEAGLAGPAVKALGAMTPEDLEQAADRLLAGTSGDDEAAQVPFLGAALQVYYARHAAALDPEAFAPVIGRDACPACASRPVASLVRTDGDRANLRYLSCSLCGTEWNLPRIQCSQCGEDKAVQYFSLEGDGANAAWRAEACDDCGTYLKIFYREKDPTADPQADDLASLALDVLVDERGFARSGPNLLFHPGSG